MCGVSNLEIRHQRRHKNSGPVKHFIDSKMQAKLGACQNSTGRKQGNATRILAEVQNNL
jgi:hypothetical protein